MRPVALDWPILKVRPLHSIFVNPEAVFTILRAIAWRLNYGPSFTSLSPSAALKMLLGSPGQWLLLSKATALDENVVLWTGSRVSPRRPTGFAWQPGTAPEQSAPSWSLLFLPYTIVSFFTMWNNKQTLTNDCTSAMCDSLESMIKNSISSTPGVIGSPWMICRNCVRVCQFLHCLPFCGWRRLL